MKVPVRGFRKLLCAQKQHLKKERYRVAKARKQEFWF